MPPRTQYLPVAGFPRRIRESPRQMTRGLRAKRACPRVLMNSRIETVAKKWTGQKLGYE